MTNRIKESWKKIEPNEITKKKMFDNILHQSRQTSNKRCKGFISAMACVTLVLIIGIFTFPKIIHHTEPVTSTVPTTSSNDLAPNLYATLYIPNEDYSSLKPLNVECKDNKPDGIIDALISYNVLPGGLHLNNYSISDDGKEYSSSGTVKKVIGTLTAHMDLPNSFVEYLNNLTEKQEKAVTASLVNTFILRDHLNSIKITIDGKPFVTDREDYSTEIKTIEL